MGFLPFFLLLPLFFFVRTLPPHYPGVNSHPPSWLDLTPRTHHFLRKERKTVWVSLSLFTNHLFSCFVKKPLTSYLPQQEEKKIDSKQVSILLFHRNFLRPTRYIGEHFGPAVQGRFFFRVFFPLRALYSPSLFPIAAINIHLTLLTWNNHATTSVVPPM